MNRIAVMLSAALVVAPAAALAQAGPFLATEGPDLWRASRLVGVDVLGPDGRKIGRVTDVLVDHDGRAADVVIGVGGVLGIGRKDVALPFAQVRFTQEARPGGTGPAASGQAPAANGIPAPAAAVGGPVGTTTGVPGGRATGLAATPAAPPGGTAASPHGTTRPDHATVDLTAEQLKSAPAFTFAR